jgi:hypothetical protein
LLRAVETVKGNETETVTDSIFGFPLIVSLYDGAGNLLAPSPPPHSMRELLRCIMRGGARLPVGQTHPGTAGPESAGERILNHGRQADSSPGLPNRAFLAHLNLTPDDMPSDLPPDPHLPRRSLPPSQSCGPASSKTR